MTRVVRTVPLGENGKRYRVVLTDVPSTGPDIRARQYAFLLELVNTGFANGVMDCGPVGFERLTMMHDGQAWVATLEAEEL